MKIHNTPMLLRKRVIFLLFFMTVLLSSHSAMAQCSTDAGPDQTVCSTVASVELAGNLNGSTGNWITTGSGTLMNYTTETPTYVPDPADYGQTITFSLINDQVGCSGGVVNDDIQITIAASPQINAYANTNTLCETVAADNLQGFQLNTALLNANAVSWIGSGGTFFPDANSLLPRYVASASEITSGYATATATTTDQALSCAAVSSTVDLYIDSYITADAGPDQTVCSSVSVISLSGTSNAGEVSWMGGTGYMESPSSTSTNYYPAGGEAVAGGSITFTLSGQTGSSCGAPTDDVTIFFIGSEPLIVDHPANFGMCKSVASSTGIDLEAHTASGYAIQWLTPGGPVSGNTVHYVPTSSQLLDGAVVFTVNSSGDPCGSIAQNINVNFGNDPTLNPFTDPITACGTSPITLSSPGGSFGYGKWSGGDGTISGCTSCVNTVYNPSALESTQGSSIVLTLSVYSSSPACTTAVTQPLTINFTGVVPDVTITSDVDFCNTGTIQVTATSTSGSDIEWSGGAGTFVDANALSTIYNLDPAEQVDGSGIYLTITTINNGSCPAATASQYFSVHDAPTLVNAGSDQTLCSSQPSALVSETVQGYIKSPSILDWSTSGTGTFSSNVSAQLPKESSKPAVGYIYTPSALDRSLGTVTLTYTYPGPCSAQSDNLILTFETGVVVNAGPDQQICVTDIGNPVQLAGVVTPGNDPDIVWYTYMNSSNFDNANIVNATYLIAPDDRLVQLVLSAGQNSSCGVVTDTMAIIVNEIPEINIPSSSYNICAGDVFNNLSVNNVSAVTWGTVAGTGVFTPGITSSVTQYTPGATETSVTFKAQATALPGCANVDFTASYAVNIYALPIANAGSDQLVCGTSSFATMAATPPTGASVGVWTKADPLTDANIAAANSANAQIIPFYEGIATFVWTLSDPHIIKGESAYCSSSDQATVTHIIKPVTVSDNLVAPAGIKKTVDVTTNDNYYNIPYTITLADQGKYPSLNKVTATTQGVLSFENYTPYVAGKDTVIYNVSLACGISGNDTIFVDLVNGPPIIEHPALTDTTVKKIPKVPVNVSVDFTDILYDYNNNIDWDTVYFIGSISGVTITNLSKDGVLEFSYSSARSSVFTGTDKIDFYVKDVYGDSVVVRYTLEILPDYQNPSVKPDDFQVVNAVSPNGDGVNDFMFVYGVSEYHNTVIIYNRWSQKVWEGQNYDNNLVKFEGKGNVDGIEGQLPEGTYFFVIKNEGKDENGEHVGLHSGYLELRR